MDQATIQSIASQSKINTEELRRIIQDTSLSQSNLEAINKIDFRKDGLVQSIDAKIREL